MNEHAPSQFQQCFCILKREQERERERKRKKETKARHQRKKKPNAILDTKHSLRESAFFLKAETRSVITEILESAGSHESRAVLELNL